MTRKIGTTEVAGSLQFDGTVSGFSEHGETSVTSGISVAGNSIHVEGIALSKSGNNAGRIHMEHEPAQPGGNYGLQMYITEYPNDATSVMSRQYGKSLYSKNGATLWLSGQTYSTFNDAILIEDAWIDNSVPEIKIQFRNTTGSSRTLRYYASWQVWQCDIGGS